MLDIKKIELIVFDFDGVLTNDKVLVDQNGIESVVCSRSDGLGFDVLKILEKSTYIISTELNMVVSKRAEKLGIPVLQGVQNKKDIVKKLSKEKKINLSNILFVGNDLNDYHAMKFCGYSVCPSDSHPVIKDMASYVLKTKGGDGVVRELLEEVFKLNILKILY
jgi:3-deoxy-D-manno-octulosonate 8-phosphate phosphatase (KDO 8-P phosphatase)